MTTNKDIYALDEKAIIIGVLPESAPVDKTVFIKVTGARGECAAENTLPRSDNSFRSRPLRLDECGLGEFTVSVLYADLETTSSFTISNSSQTDAGSKLELRTLKSVMLQALDVVNTRVKELIQSGYVMPEEIASKYREGVSEASLALEAIEFGDAAEAKQHMIFAIPDFREVLSALSENVARYEEADQPGASDKSVVGTYNRLQDNYDRLRELAETNNVDKEEEFGEAAVLLSEAKRMIDAGSYEGVEQKLEKVAAILEEITAGLYDEEKKEKLASDTNSTSQADEELAKKMSRYANYADELEKRAYKLLNQTSSNSTAGTKVLDALALIQSARDSIEAQDLESAKSALSAVDDALDEVEDLIKEEDDSDTSTSDDRKNSDGNSGESSEDSDDSNKDKGRDDDDEGSSGSNDDTEEDQ